MTRTEHTAITPGFVLRTALQFAAVSLVTGAMWAAALNIIGA